MPLFGGGQEEAQAKLAALYASRAEWMTTWRAGLRSAAFVERIGVASTGQDTRLEAYAQLDAYVAELGLRPEDTFGIALEQDEVNDFNRVVAVAVVYRDSAEYAAARDRFWSARPELQPPPLDPKA